MKVLNCLIVLVVILMMAMCGFMTWLACDLAVAVKSGTDGVFFKHVEQ